MRRCYIISLILLTFWLILGQKQTEAASQTQERLQPSTKVTVIPLGTDPNHPLPLKMGINVGVLEPGEERWFAITLHKPGTDDSVYIPLTLSLYFTPNIGTPPDQVNLALFDAETPRIWSAGYPEEIQSFGEATLRPLDDDPLTSEKVWAGTLIDDSTTYIRLHNDDDFVVDFLICTFDKY